MFDDGLNTSSSGESDSPPTSAPSQGVSRAGNRAGSKVIHDSRGNAVWHWDVATGVFARIKANELLTMIEDPTLALEGECGGEWAGDPYNRR
jgi:hypothetical protein